MAIAKKRAEVVSSEALAKSIDAAVARATKQLGITTGKPNLAFKWEIVGRVVKNMKAGDAFELAQSISAGIKVPGVEAQPAISKIPGGILVGFIERAQLPRSFGGR